MFFGLFRRKKKQSAAGEVSSPLQAFDEAIEELERQAAQVRRSAAALLSLKGQLNRDVERHQQTLLGVEARLDAARAQGQPDAERVLDRDRLESARLLEVAQQALAQVSSDAQTLIEVAEELAARLGELRVERQSASLRRHAGLVVSAALRQRMDRVGQMMKLDAARDEVERAHQLAQIYREDRAAGG